jgi:hypothetical protein
MITEAAVSSEHTYMKLYVTAYKTVGLSLFMCDLFNNAVSTALNINVINAAF